ncbi:hypothetical protein [Evansella cellulosilytica]|uniref:Uncharacterized protein n=1 Tax=Evansella cellulosilytica (strain ATCC 21833 / DSM 2522 / FERM P-1141 / JCM 9156 / N-4) TaxID=649639 RepID=E6TR84_EVAC2|nr:hypothetical protein [Evansella cellulosilytica]ADU30596.1 hypothetical protein Bcell_2337 [Evansella cellulosilytica DSM 2522]
MNYLPLIIISALICIAALIATIYIGMNPNDKNYTKSTKQRMYILSGIYVVTFVPAIIFTLLYFYYKG